MSDTPPAPTPDQTPIYTQLLAEYAAAADVADRPDSEPAPADQTPDDASPPELNDQPPEDAAERGPANPGGRT